MSRLQPASLTRIFLAALLLAGLATGCAAADADSGALYERPGAPDAGNQVDRGGALQALANHEVARSNALYDEMLDRDRTNQGYAAAGVAITETMLLPGLPPSDTLMVNHLAADGEGLDATRAIYAEQGYLYWISRGAQWESRGQFDGIKSLIADRLPWPESRLGSLAAFVEGLTDEVGGSREDLRAVTRRMRSIEANIDLALADAQFDRFVLPGEALHDDRLTLTLGKSELAILGATLAATRGAVRFMLAYEHGWSLQQAFGAQWQEEADKMGGDHPDWAAWDYSLKFLDEQLVRTPGPEAITDLDASRTAFIQAIDFAIRGIDHGLDQSFQSSLAWGDVDRTYAERLRTFLNALKKSLAQPTELPSTDPTTSADFSPLFDGGRTLDAEIAWLVDTRTEESMADRPVWALNDRALQPMFVEGIFDPEFDLTQDITPEFTLDGEPWTTFSDNLFGPVRSDFESAYLSTR